MSPGAPNLNYAWARALIAGCVRGGARHAVVCPGSRSSPLAVTCAETEELRTLSVVDERSAGFFALGLARATGRPVVLVATSGSAGAHFLPAAIEATHSHVPLVLLTADRPWELQGFGAPQTIAQQRLFGQFVRRFDELIAPDASDAAFTHLHNVVARALDAATSTPRGPVHLNVPFHEPLAPVERPFVAPIQREPVQLHRHPREPSAELLSRLAALIAAHERGLIVCGPRWEDDGFGAAVAELGRSAGYPVIAEATSGARFGAPASAPVIGHIDLLLRSEPFARGHAPELVLRFGGGITSRRLQQWLDSTAAPTVLVSDDGALFDPAHHADVLVEARAPALATALAKTAPGRTSPWLESFLEAERRARSALEEALPQDGPLCEPVIARAVAAALPEDAALFVSSSMPIRDLDAFASADRPSLRALCNRGANGIDGIVSTALGVSLGTGRPTALLTGDLAFLHDLGGLLTARRHDVRLTVVVVNNDGGGIFSHLPIAGTTPHFEALFGTPHGLDLSAAARLFGARFHRVTRPGELAEAVRSSVEAGLTIVEARTDREAGPLVLRELGERVGRAVEHGGGR